MTTRTLSQIEAAIDKLTAAGAPRPSAVDDVLRAFGAVAAPGKARGHAAAALGKALEAGDDDAARVAATEYAAATMLLQDTQFYGMAETKACRALLAAFDLDAAYAAVRDRYNDAGKRMHKTLELVDPDESPEVVAAEHDGKRAPAWASVPDLVRELNADAELLRLIVCELAGRPFNGTMPSAWIGLCVDVSDANPRHIIEAWKTPTAGEGKKRRIAAHEASASVDDRTQSRAGRWGAVAAAGGRLAAPKTISEYAPLPVLPALVKRGDGTMCDPCDPAEREEAQRILVSRKGTPAHPSSMPEEWPTDVDMSGLVADAETHAGTETPGLDSFAHASGLAD